MKRNKKLSRKVHETGLLDLTGSGRPRISQQLCGAAWSSRWLMVQSTNGQHTCELVFKPKADILNMRCDCQFVFSVFDELYASHHVWCNRCCSKSALYSVSQKKVAPPKTFCDIFCHGEPVQLKITLVIAQTYFYVYTNLGPFIWIFVWNVSFLPVWPLKF